MKLYEIGQQIKTLRESKKLTQEQLATKCGISRVTLGKVERGELGNTSVKTLVRKKRACEIWNTKLLFK